ncbi:hypothetical protein [Blastococcus brunescens]|uniref:Uncharacterized protein n=1 Tax=Blastococcus brunescens TaxID=1564165 RepID=A0ABZ1B1Q1_9ACTN|nr:hypothetical protein [Blastococcus sp. BMG 8361]WRL64736.1 hypothetical protein U6N30_02870 [Blastococcus sp. BMG 8361]
MSTPVTDVEREIIARQLGRPRAPSSRWRTVARAVSPTWSRPRPGWRTAPRSRRCTT